MKLFDITQQDRFTSILTMYQSFIGKERLENSLFLSTGHRTLIWSKAFCCFSDLIEKEIGNCILYSFIEYFPGSLPMIE